MIEVFAPDPIPDIETRGMPLVFLAGSIANGRARQWQREFVAEFSGSSLVFLNPRRLDWDSSWEPVASNPQFREQVEWELAGLRVADAVVFYFDVNVIAPVSMLELGLTLSRGCPVFVCCPDGYHRQGNVEIVCEQYGVRVSKDMRDLIADVRQWTLDTLA